MSRSFPHVLIRASAGTGKTFQLSNRYLALLESGAAPDRILATTFTRKAAAEILDRIVLRLAEATEDEAARGQLASFLDCDSLSKDRCEELLAELLRNLHRLHVGTLDSFFAQVARSMSLEIGLPLAWQIVDQLQDAALRDEAIEAVVHKEKPSDLLTLTHLLTKGEASRTVGQLIRNTVNDLEALYQETDADAWQKVPRPKPLDDNEFVLLLEELRTLEMNDTQLERTRDADYQRALVRDWEKFIGTGVAKKVAAGEQIFSRKPIPEHARGVYSRLIEHARALLVSRVAMQTEGSHDLLKQFDSEYRQLKSERRATRFSDITRSLARPLRDAAAPEAMTQLYRSLAFRLDGQIQHILLDEFQDTAPMQWEVLRPFATRVTNRSSAGSFFCVGDTKQAIYGWRGGVAEIFDAISAHLPDLQTQELNTSFRSSQSVIDTVNSVFRSLSEHTNLGRSSEAVCNWQRHFEVHSTARSDLPGYACLFTPPTDADLLTFAADHVAKVTHEAPSSTIGVLLRRNQAVGQLIGLLRDRNVFASEEGGNPLTDSAAVQLVLSLAHLLDHPGDTVARFHVASSRIGSTAGLPDHVDANAAWRFSQAQRVSLVERGYGPTVSEWSEWVRPHCAPRDSARLTQLVELAYAYQCRATGRVDDFVRFIENERVADPTTARVRVMTIHQAKGLEFDVVVLPELEGRLVGQPDSFVVHRETPTSPVDRVCRYVNSDLQQLLPKSFQQMFQETTDRVATESLCVLYVALTRAVHALHMIIAPSTASEKRLPQTYAGLLRSSLRDDQPAAANAVLYEHGDRRWYQQLKRPERETRTTQTPMTGKIQLASGDGTRRRGLERRSPSSLEGGSRVSLKSVFASRESPAMMRGSIIHAWFEVITWLEDGIPEESQLRAIADRLLINSKSPLDIDAMLGAFRDMLQAKSIRAALSKASYSAGRLVVENERTFAVVCDGQLLNGSIDRIVWSYDGRNLVSADIIDFKTDRVATNDELAAKIAFYSPQLQAYREAACQMSGLPLEQVSTRLLFVDTGVVADV